MSHANTAARLAIPAPDPASGTEVAAVDVADSRDVNLVTARATRPATCGERSRAPDVRVARIRQRGRSPNQSGRARESIWFLTFERRYRTEIEPLMGWTSCRDTLQQVELRFSTSDEAVAFAKRRGLQFVVETPHLHKFKRKSYADNFRHDRLQPWTH